MQCFRLLVAVGAFQAVTASSDSSARMCSLADEHLCEFVCPCCRDGLAVANQSHLDESTELFAAPLLAAPRSWEAEPWPMGGDMGVSSTWSPTFMYAVKDDDFHKTVLEQVTQDNNLSSFIKEHFADNETDFAAKKERMSWTDNELAIWLYTIENPKVYMELNEVLRDAATLVDVDPFWQAYISYLVRGLQNYTAYVDVALWRGVLTYGEPVGKLFNLGQRGVLPQFTSATPNQDLARGFGDVLLHFTGGGYDISSYSEYPFEGQVLLEPGRQYQVLSMVMPTANALDARALPIVTLGTFGPAGLRRPGSDSPVATALAMRCPSEAPDICPACACCPAVAAALAPGHMPSRTETLAAIFGLPFLGAVVMAAVTCNTSPRRPLEARELLLG